MDVTVLTGLVPSGGEPVGGRCRRPPSGKGFLGPREKCGVNG